jgi:hypothetical protein
VAPTASAADFYVRQLWDWKGSAQIDSMDARGLTAYAEICGTTLAHAHARGGDRIAIGAYLGKGDTFDRAIAEFAEAYAAQNERDYESLRRAAAEAADRGRAGPCLGDRSSRDRLRRALAYPAKASEAKRAAAHRDRSRAERDPRRVARRPKSLRNAGTSRFARRPRQAMPCGRAGGGLRSGWLR